MFILNGKLHYCNNIVIFNEMKNMFRLADSAFPQLCCLKFLCK